MQTPSKIVFLVLSALCTQLLCLTDHNVDNNIHKTPQRSVPVDTIESTPGQIVSKRQTEILTKERFSAVLGERVINSWGIDWSVFIDHTLDFDEPQKSGAISVIHNKMTALLKKRFDEEFMTLYGSVACNKGTREAVHADRLDSIAIRYFTELYPNALNVELLDKQSGVQLGKRIKVDLPNRISLVYHVKTHSEGRLSEKSTAPKLVNPQELLVYKILELLGFCCEVHFFEKSPEDVYITTLDANFVTRDKKGEFNVFQKAAGRVGMGGDKNYGQTLWGALYSLRWQIRETAEVEAWTTLEESLQSDEIAQNFMHQQSTLDIITRIMRFCDLLNNPENFGFLSCDDTPSQLRVIDFRVIDDPTRLKMTDDQFGGYLVGNGVYNYASSHDTMCYVLRNRPLEGHRQVNKNGLLV